tara:strand:+ start:355 stop:846 length:492 start_codon:yes stop_codon:yes gene_type:complete
MGTKRVGLARTQALIENLKRELTMEGAEMTNLRVSRLSQSFDAAAAPGTTSQTITIAQILTGVLADDPEGNGTWTLPTAALAVAGVSGVAIGDCIDFAVVNDATSAADEKITVAMGTGGTAVGLMVVDSQLVAGIRGSGSGLFRIRFTGVASGSEAYTCYRLA